MAEAMREFLKQFELLNSFAVETRHLKNPELLTEAKQLGFVGNWEPPKGCTYHGTVICTLKGRLYVKRSA